MDEHLKRTQHQHPVQHLVKTVTKPRYIRGFATTALLSTGGFMLMPFGSAFSVHNLGIAIDRLPMVYLCTGICTIFSGPIIGRLADKMGKFQVFALGSFLTIGMVLIYTHLGVTPIGIVILITAMMFIGVSSRMISSSALISGVPDMDDRGSYMSISASIQQISGGLAAALAGIIVFQNKLGMLENYDQLGYVVIVATLVSVVMMYQINRMISVKS